MSIEQGHERVEIGVSTGFALAHGWVVHAISGFLSAYYMEDPRFRVERRYHDLKTGLEVWVCLLEKGLSLQQLFKRLRVDIPPCRVFQHPNTELPRYIIDVPEKQPAADSSQS